MVLCCHEAFYLNFEEEHLLGNIQQNVKERVQGKERYIKFTNGGNCTTRNSVIYALILVFMG
jgi:hypothetical protein